MRRRAALGRMRRRAAVLGWKGRRGKFVLSFFKTPISFLNKQPFEFKVRFESKHPKTMHLHECNRELLYFIN
jgi:hypothetical protein